MICADTDEFAQIDAWFVCNRIVDFIFITDIGIIMMTAQKDGRKLITGHTQIVLNYARSWLLFDLAASIPLDLILWLATGAHMGEKSDTLSRSAKLIRVIKIFRTLRMLRLLRLKRVVLTIELFFGFNFNVMGIGKFLVAICLLAHLLACGFLGISVDGGWIEQQLQPNSQGEQPEATRYIASMYWAFTTVC